MAASTTFTQAAASLLAGIALAASACGDGADEPGSATANTRAKSTPAPGVDLTPMLMRTGEEPGFRRGALPDAVPRKRETFTGVDAFAKAMDLPTGEVRRLRREGFLAFTVAPIRGPRDTAGLTNVALYETAGGAQRAMAHDLRPGVIRAYGPIEGLRFFSVPGVPGARGWKASEPPVANALWVQGRCYLTLGNQGPGRLERALSIGARAIYKRTKDLCA